MSDLRRIEEQLSQLISMVAKNNEMIAKNNETVAKVSEKLDELEEKLEMERALNKARYEELIKEIRHTKFEINHLRDKTAKNEMEIDVIK
ncbi:MAG TPA: hypothetical protein VJ824_05555 [Bacillota bacterium]|nr:hypothetical protein [Bacillota bacterium]